VHPKALHWQAAFPEVFSQGGFVVVGNPPYVRQEWLSDYKPYRRKGGLKGSVETFLRLA
jgi:hypothetical protein